MDPLLIILFIVLFLLSAFFSGTEIALMSLPAHKINSLVRHKNFWSKSLKKIKENNDRLLIAILIWNNLVNVYTAALATTIAIWMASWAWIAQAQAVWIATWIVTFFLLLFGEIIPKSFATKNASTISLLVAPIYKILILILFPVIYFIEIIIKVFSGKKKIEQITDEEIECFIDMWKKTWSLDHKEHEKIKSILEFDDTTVEEIMTPRVKIDAVSWSMTVKDAMEFYLFHTHSRLPVYTKRIDKIDFFITSRDLISQFVLWNHNKKISDLILKKVLKVPLNQPIDKLMETFQSSHKIMAIVMDEYGWVSGLITMEDIIEEVFGEIRDETDKETEEFIEIGKNSLRVKSDVLIEDILEKFDLNLENIWLDEREFDWETLSFIITHILEDFPIKDQELKFNIIWEDWENGKVFCLKILEIENAKIWQVDVSIEKK